MTTFEIKWLENNSVNYERFNSIVKEHPNGITSKELVTIYNTREEIKEKLSKDDPMTLDTFNYMIKNVQRAKNTFYNVIKFIYDKKTKKWLTINESNNEEIIRLKLENERLKESLNNITTVEDW